MKSYGDSVRLGGPGTERIGHVLLLYVGVEDGLWTVSRWHASIEKDGLEATEEQLLKLARSGEGTCGPEFQGYGFEGIKFVEYMSYFTIVLDAKGYSFEGETAVDPLLFLEKKVNSTLPPPPAPVAPNKSFYDLSHARVSGLPALRCINYLRNGYTGEPLKDGETQGFIFNLYIHAHYAQGSKTGIALIIDPDGTNSGPRR